MDKLPAVFSGMAVIFGLLLLTKYKENRSVKLAFYLSLFASGVTRIVFMKVPFPGAWIDIAVMLVFGIASLLEVWLLVRERTG